MKNSTQILADAAKTLAMRGAAEYLRAHNLQADNGALAECLCSWIKIKLPEALGDAKEAFACHMDAVGVATFSATMFQAGIEAAKEASCPVLHCDATIAAAFGLDNLPSTLVRIHPDGGVPMDWASA